MNTAHIIESCLDWAGQHYSGLLLKDTHADINKAGIVPLYKGELLLIKPKAKKKHLGPPPWQLAKGTRMIKEHGDWQDYRLDDPADAAQLEPLLCTALREGIEEAGLRLDNIAKVKSLGIHSYRSISTGKEKTMQLYAVAMHDKQDFDWPDDDHKVTEAMQWFELDHLPSDLRPDALEIITQVTLELGMQ